MFLSLAKILNNKTLLNEVQETGLLKNKLSLQLYRTKKMLSQDTFVRTNNSNKMDSV